MASSIYPLFLLQRCNFMIQLNPRVNNPAVGTFYVLLSAIFFSLGGFMIKIVPWQSLSVSGVRSIFALITLLLYMKLIHHPFRLNPSVIFGGICWSHEHPQFLVSGLHLLQQWNLLGQQVAGLLGLRFLERVNAKRYCKFCCGFPVFLYNGLYVLRVQRTWNSELKTSQLPIIPPT